MKTSLLTKLSGFICFLVLFQRVNAQTANTALSNLAATAVNADLLPGATNARSLGSAGKSWKDLYLGNLLYLGGARVLTVTSSAGLNNTGLGVSSLLNNTSGYSNTGLGASTLHSNTTGFNNVAIGYGSLFFSAAGHNNVAIGALSLYKNTSGVSNSAMGNSALTNNTTGNNNMGIGANALGNNTTGSGNVGIGLRSMFSNKVLGYEVAIGDSALFSNTGGAGANTAIGSKALFSTTSGGGNVGIGTQALFANTTGDNNVAVGPVALKANTTGMGNVAIGSNAMVSNTTGLSNTATGFAVMAYNTEGARNTANGYYSMFNTTTGSDNTALGVNTLSSLTTGSMNTAVGAAAMNRTATTNYNCAFGANALFNTLADDNTALGYQALFASTSGSENVSVGYESGYYLKTGIRNTGIGNYSLANVSSGYYNSAIGYNATVADGAFFNSTALGSNALASASNQVMLGDNSVTSVKAASSVVIYSDGRFKNDIRTNVPGLEFISQLRPVTYQYNIHGMNEAMGVNDIRHHTMGSGRGTKPDPEADRAEESAINAKEKKRYSGFVAQEVEKAANALGYEFSGVYKPQNEKDLYGLSYSDFVVPLVKAVQQLNDTLTQERAKNDSVVSKLEAEIAELRNLIKNPGVSGSVSDASLQQNVPNPVKQSTTIRYSLPRTYSRAKITVTDMSGRVMKNIGVTGAGQGNLNLDAASLSSGVYNYSLYVDDRLVDTRQMLLTK